MPRSFLILLCACAVLAGTRALAQDGRDLSEEARKQYAQGLHEASAMVKDRQFANAQAKLDVLLTQRPREPQARFLKGVVQTEEGQDAAAIATFSRIDRGLSRAAGAVQQSGGAVRAERRVRRRPHRARVRGENRAGLGDCAREPGRHLRSPWRRRICDAPRSSITRTRRRPPKLNLARELLAPTPKPATATAVTPKP